MNKLINSIDNLNLNKGNPEGRDFLFYTSYTENHFSLRDVIRLEYIDASHNKLNALTLSRMFNITRLTNSQYNKILEKLMKYMPPNSLKKNLSVTSSHCIFSSVIIEILNQISIDNIDFESIVCMFDYFQLENIIENVTKKPFLTF